MFKLMDKKMITILCSKFCLNLTYVSQILLIAFAIMAVILAETKIAASLTFFG